MKNELIKFETAKLAKEKGFDEKCYWYCTYKRKIPTNDQEFYPELSRYKNYNSKELNFYEQFSLAEQSLLQKWLRETHNCFVDVTYHGKESEDWNIESIKDIKFGVEVDFYGNFDNLTEECDFNKYNFDTYEEALEAGLYQALLLI